MRKVIDDLGGFNHHPINLKARDISSLHYRPINLADPKGIKPLPYPDIGGKQRERFPLL
jgi:hypothetical protein